MAEGTPQGTPQFAALHDQNMAALGQVATLIQVNMQKVDKVIDYNYLEGKDLVSLTEAMGAREVGSRVNPSGPVPATQ